MKNRKKYIVPIVLVILINIAVLFYINVIEGGDQLSNRILNDVNENPYNPGDNRFINIVKKIFRLLSQIIDKFIWSYTIFSCPYS